MLRNDGQVIFSASDLVNFMGCAHATFLDIGNMSTPHKFAPSDDNVVLLQEKGIEHERAYLETLRLEGRSIAEIAGDVGLAERVRLTRAAMRDGADVIYQGAFANDAWHGYSDFLLRIDTPSKLGDHSYEVADTKLSRSAKPKHLLQLCVYADLLAREQGLLPPHMHVVLGNGTTASLRTNAVIHYFAVARTRFEAFTASPPDGSTGDPCGHCTFCRWSTACDDIWEAQNHLGIVAGLNRGQVDALRAAGIPSLVQLAALPEGARVPGIQPATLSKLMNQARLQEHQRRTGERLIERLPAVPGRGFDRLPVPDLGDLFFDMEGDPLFEDGLEYLFGVVSLHEGERFHAFWAHDRAAEKKAFQETIDLMVGQLAKYPKAYIYHYASYEESALKRLAMYHGTRETEVDDLLREGRLVDLYKVVREAIRTSEPRYSIKNMEKFYLEGGRGGEVKTAGDSIVMYERWRSLGDQQLLDDISSYNELDCRSTFLCRDWLLTLRPADSRWFTGPASANADPQKSEGRREAEERTADMTGALLAEGDQSPPWRQLVADLLEFHRREAKPTYWAMFSRQDGSTEELLDDAECIADLSPAPGIAPRTDKRSTIHTFTFPPQDFKFKVGDAPLRSGTLEPAGDIVSLDEEKRLIELKMGPSRSAIIPGTSLIPAGPVGDKALRDAVYRYADAVARGDEQKYPAITAILRRDQPRLRSRKPSAPIVAENQDATDGAVVALKLLDRSYLLIQGPPGAGKTYTSSQAIVALLAQGMRIGVASNSHKAINNLLAEVEAMATAQGLRCRGVKKSSRDDQKLGTGGWIEDTNDNKGVTSSHQLVAGTAWLFARPELDLAFDYLFIDEAGQVGLANVVAMGVASRNIVLVGDQMQLSQPVKGTHPRSSGLSALDYLLGDNPTVPPTQGVFLPVTRRMHPDLCQFISEAVYDGRLSSEASTGNQRIEVDVTHDPEALAAFGLRFVEVQHTGCTQRSPEEVERLTQTYRALIGASWVDRDGTRHRMGVQDILVVSPYNMQVELLKQALPVDARVGTVDKFQGQEAAAVLISMATSSGDDLPRNIEFLYSKNRLNVAISRARCLAVIFASPRLLEIPCTTIEQMELVDGLCWAKQFADAQRDNRQ